MKIIRWLLSHLFLILLIVVVIYGYMFWGNLTGENTPVGKVITYLSDEFVEVGEFVNAVKAKQAQVSEERADEPLETNASASSDENKKADDFSAADNKQLPVSAIYSPNSSNSSNSPKSAQVKQNTAGFIEQKADTQQHVASTGNINSYNSQVNASAKSTQPTAFASRATGEQRGAQVPPANDSFIPEKIAKQIENVDNSGKVIDPSLPASDVRSSWLTARKSFYQRKYDVSEKNYQYVIDSTEDNFDAYGELGNVYFNQGKNKQAAAAYFSAASILVRKGQARRAKSLVGLLRHLDKDKAEELQKLIASAES